MRCARFALVKWRDESVLSICRIKKLLFNGPKAVAPLRSVSFCAEFSLRDEVGHFS